MAERITLVETPRDAFQGLPGLIPTDDKISFIHGLLEAGYRHLDLGSFVSPKAVPQMADTTRVLDAFRERSDVERIALVANEKGVERALSCGGLDALAFPFSLSHQFQQRNARRSVLETWPLVQRIRAAIEPHDLSLIVYISMAFGNPDGEPWDEGELHAMVAELHRLGIRHISFADTIGVARPDDVHRVFKRAIADWPDTTFSAHFHGRPGQWWPVVDAALTAGCRRFDCATGGLGGCPFAQDALVANIPSEELAEGLETRGFTTGIHLDRARACAETARDLQRRFGYCG